jgi:nitrogen-specific signal transduction histidine kinase
LNYPNRSIIRQSPPAKFCFDLFTVEHRRKFVEGPEVFHLFLICQLWKHHRMAHCLDELTVTEREAALRKLEAMPSDGLVIGLAHEIRNPLAGIAGVIEIVSRDLPPGSPARFVIKDAKEKAVRINRILIDLLETVRPMPPQFQVNEIEATAEHAVMFARQQAITKRIMIELEKDEDIPRFERSQSDQSGAAERGLRL